MTGLPLNIADRMILTRIVAYAAGFACISLLVLLLERMLRIFELTANSNESFGYVAQMLLNLIPHYLGIALPASFFLAVLLTINRMSENGELTALLNAGVGLPRILQSIMCLAFVLTIIVTSIVSVVQPHSRYTYRKVAHTVAHQSLAAGVREGAFVTKDDLTFMAERRQHAGDRLTGIFVYSKKADGRSVVTTAPYGALSRAEDGNGSVLALRQGVQTHFKEDGPVSGSLRFDAFDWRLDANRDVAFRARGEGVREMTLFELWSARDDPRARVSARKIAAELNSRLVRAATVLILPLLAIPFGLSGGRAGQSSGIAVGLIILVLYQKAIEFGTSFGAAGAIPVWLGAWSPFLALAVLSSFLFLRVSYAITEPPLAIVSRSLASLIARVGRT